MVLSREIKNEWDRHQSGFARRWRVSMVARKRVVFIQPERKEIVRTKIQRRIKNTNPRNAVLKDFHLIEAALDTDEVVSSLDLEAKELLKKLAQDGLAEIVGIAWVNPARSEEGAIEWLKDGAELDPDRLLGAAPVDTD
jgi:hypothetical protein